MRISVIVDSPDSWFVEYGKKLCDILEKDGHDSLFQMCLGEREGDIAFLLGCRKIYATEKLKLHKSNIVVHESDLPEGKGWSPVTWEIIQGKSEITLSLFEAVEKVDSGKIYIKEQVVFNGDELLPEIRKKIADKTIKMALQYVKKYPMEGKEQEGKGSYYRRRTPIDSELDINKSINEQFNLMRVADNESYPLFFWKNNRKYILKISKDET